MLEENMGKKYEVESDFDDLHGNPAEAPDLELDLSDSDNPIIQAALSGEEDDDWTPPKKDDDEEPKKKVLDDDDDDDDDGLIELDSEDDEEDDEEDAEEDDEEDEDEEDDDEDDKEKHSAKVQKRIDRERDIRLASEQASNRRIAKLEKKLELQTAQTAFDKEEADAQKKLRALRKKKTAALDEDDNAAIVDIDDQILDIKAERKAKQLQLDQQLKDLDSDDDDATTGTPAAGQVWIQKYPEFHSNNQFKQVVLLTDRSVAARGFDKNSEEYYEEMENLLRPQFPNIIKAKKVAKASKNAKRKAAAKKKRSAVGSTQKAGTSRSTSKRGRKVIRLTKADQENMEIFGMDPKNPKEARAWAENKTD
jgi:hypothetical protein